MGRTHKKTRRKHREIRTQSTNPPQRRTPHGVVPVDRIGGGDPDNEFDHSDDWLTPYEPSEDAL